MLNEVVARIVIASVTLFLAANPSTAAPDTGGSNNETTTLWDRIIEKEKDSVDSTADGESDFIEGESDFGEADSESSFVDSDQPYAITDQHFDIFDFYGSTEYDAFVEITNTSPDPLYISDASFDLEDSSGHLMQTDSMISTTPDVIPSGEKGYLFYSWGSLEIDDSVNVSDAHFVPHFSAEKASDQPHEYPVSDLSIAPDDEFYHVKLIGRMTNDTGEESNCYLTVVYYDADGKCLGISGTNVTADPGDTVSFEDIGMSLPHDFDFSAIADYKIYSYESYYQF